MVDLLSVQPLPEAGDWPETIAQIENGWYPTGGPVDPGNDNGIANWQARDLAIRTRILRERLDDLALKAGTLTTVGPGGDFATLNAALAVLSERRPAYAPGGYVSEIRLLTGYQMAEQVLVRGAGLGWLTITAEAGEVVIVRGALATMFGSSYPAFGAGDGGTLPRISALFTMDATGPAANRVGVYAGGNGAATISPGAGIRNAGAYGVRLDTGGQISANGAVLTGAGESAVYASGATRAAFAAADLSNAGTDAITATNGAVVHADAAICTGANGRGIYSQRGAIVNAISVNARKNGAAGADTPQDFVVDQGGTIVAIASLGGKSTTVNEISASGVIYA